MKSTALIFSALATTIALSANLSARAGMPTVKEPNPPSVAPTSNEQPEAGGNDGSVTTAAVSKIEVACQDLQSVVRKGERQAVMMKWNTGFFGKEFTPAKRCQIVSDRLQKAAELNGGTFKGLQLSSGKVNGQPVICVQQEGKDGCSSNNILFTLKPENAKNPNAAIEKIMTFAQDGSTAVEESASTNPKVDRDLGSWEKKAFPQVKGTANRTKKPNGGF